MKVAVVGGGIIGLACAWELARAGVSALVLDAAPEAREASWAAAGMLAPHHECEEPSALWRLGVASLERWPAFARALGGDIDLRLDGGAIPALDDADEAALDAKEAFLRGVGVPCQRLAGDALRARLPAFAPRVRAALVVAGGSVDPRSAVRRLTDACAALGVGLRYGAVATAIGDAGVDLADGSRVAADHVVLASGAWTPALAAAAGVALAGEPVKGQLLRLAATPGLLPCFVHHPRAYLVPRAGGEIVVGATMAASGFDKAEDPAAIAALARAAGELVPALSGARIAETWTGLRPRLRDGRPVIARVRPALTIATGHFRNGILLAPITSAAVAGLVAGGDQVPGLEAFGLPGSA